MTDSVSVGADGPDAEQVLGMAQTSVVVPESYRWCEHPERYEPTYVYRVVPPSRLSGSETTR